MRVQCHARGERKMKRVIFMEMIKGAFEELSDPVLGIACFAIAGAVIAIGFIFGSAL